MTLKDLIAFVVATAKGIVNDKSSISDAGDLMTIDGTGFDLIVFATIMREQLILKESEQQKAIDDLKKQNHCDECLAWDNEQLAKWGVEQKLKAETAEKELDDLKKAFKVGKYFHHGRRS